MDTLPGDKINISTSQMLRFAPMIAPIMHSVNVYTHYFFVPNRIVWPNWEEFITGGETIQTPRVFPTVTVDGINGSLADYLGIPKNQGGAQGKDYSAIPFAAYQKIWNEYYRDQNLQIDVSANWPDDELNDGDNSAVTQLMVLRNRAWQHDYFTSALPWTQKGAEATIPLGTTAPLIFDGQLAPSAIEKNDGTSFSANDVTFNASTGTPGRSSIRVIGDVASIDVTPHTTVDLSTATAASINDLRRAFKLQEWLEKMHAVELVISSQ